MLKKIYKMHELFGVTPNWTCKDCYHLKGGVNEYRKCEIYGDTRSEATDWALSWPACGLWNKHYKGDVAIVRLQRGARKPEEQIPGQMSFLGGQK